MARLIILVLMFLIVGGSLLYSIRVDDRRFQSWSTRQEHEAIAAKKDSACILAGDSYQQAEDSAYYRHQEHSENVIRIAIAVTALIATFGAIRAIFNKTITPAKLYAAVSWGVGCITLGMIIKIAVEADNWAIYQKEQSNNSVIVSQCINDGRQLSPGWLRDLDLPQSSK